MKSNRISAVLLIVTLLFTITPCFVYANVVEPADYLQFGKYNGKPIVWRVLRENGSDLELIADKIITVKAFDSAHTDENDVYLANGSGQWETSAIRTWLNSGDVNVEYANLPHEDAVTTNAYAGDVGFLANFTDFEMSLLKPVSNTSAVNDEDAPADSGSQVLSYERDASDTAANFSDAYKAETEDYIYLPSVDDIQYIENNVYIFDTEYQRSLPTDEAIADSDTAFTGFRSDNSWFYWLRDAMYGNDESLVRCVTPEGNVEYAAANNGYVGIRPMCTIDSSKIGFSSGDGSEYEPYIVSDLPWIGIDSDSDLSVAGTHNNITVFTANLPDNVTIITYLNGNEFVPEYINGSTTFPIEVGFGVNTIDAKVLDLENNIIAATTYSYMGLDIAYTTPSQEEPFDDSSPSHLKGNLTGTFPTYWEDEMNGEFYLKSADGQDNLASYIFSKDNDDGIVEVNTYTSTALAFSTANWFSENKNEFTGADKVMAEITFKVSDFGNYRTSPITLNYRNTDGGIAYWTPFTYDAEGNFYATEIQSGRIQFDKLKIDNWYNLKLIIDNNNITATAILNNISDGTSEEEILFYNEPMIVSKFRYAEYFSTTVRGISGYNKTISFTDFNVGACEIISGQKMLGNILKGTDDKTLSVYIANTSGGELKADLIIGVYDTETHLKEAKTVKVELDADKGKTYDVKLEKTNIEDTDTVKAFLFENMIDIVPLAPSTSILPIAAE